MSRKFLPGLALLLAAPALGDRPFRGGVVATENAQASEAALEMLDRGGNAIDAAVAAAFTLSAASPYHSGLGGGGFAVIYEARTQKVRVLDFRETAPHAATKDMYVKDGLVVPGLSTDGATSVATPGAIAGYLELLSAAGRLKPDVVLAPAIRAAKKGSWVTPKYQRMARKRLDVLRKDPEAARLFLRLGLEGKPDVPPIGTVITQPELARTLETLARKGAAAFYSGPLGKSVVDTVRANGGVLAQEDLAGFHVRWREPLEGQYRGHRVATMPPPSSGGLAVLQTLGMLEQGTPKGFTFHDPAAVHRLVEAMQRVYVDRAKYLGDPAFVDVPLGWLASPEYIHRLGDTIDPNHATASRKLLAVDAGTPATFPEPKHTSHISVVDKDGNAVAMTTTINGYFGSCLVAKGTGILLNDEMDDFSSQSFAPNLFELVSGDANAIAPGKIPLSSMAPTLVFAGAQPEKVMLVLGAPGGSAIPTTVLQTISNVIDAGMDVQRAVGAGRVHHQFMPDAVMVDNYGLEPATEKALEALGHPIQHRDAWSDAQVVYVDPETGLRYAASDPRFEGAALGQD